MIQEKSFNVESSENAGYAEKSREKTLTGRPMARGFVLGYCLV